MANIQYTYDREHCSSVTIDFTVDNVGDVVAVFLNNDNIYMNVTTATTDTYVYSEEGSPIMSSYLHEFTSVIGTTAAWNIVNEDEGIFTLIATLPAGKYIIDTSTIPDACRQILAILVDDEKIMLSSATVIYIDGVDIKLIVEHEGFSWDECLDAILVSLPGVYEVYFEKKFLVYPLCELRAKLTKCIIREVCKCHDEDCCSGNILWELAGKYEAARLVLEDGHVKCAAKLFDEIKNCLAQKCNNG